MSRPSISYADSRIVFIVRAVTYCVRIIPFHPPELELRGAQSKECQKRAWKTSHKYNCTPNLPPAGEADPSKPYNKIISAWQNEWKVVLDAFAVLALDLENNPEKNATHWCVLCSVIVFPSNNFFAFSMWLEFKYIGGGANSGKFRVSVLLLLYFVFPPHHGTDHQRRSPHKKRSARRRSPPTYHARNAIASRETSTLCHDVPFRRGGQADAVLSSSAGLVTKSKNY